MSLCFLLFLSQRCSALLFFSLCLFSVPSQPPQNVRAISVTSDEAAITWAEPPRMTLHGVLKGYRVVFWAVFPDGGNVDYSKVQCLCFTGGWGGGRHCPPHIQREQVLNSSVHLFAFQNGARCKTSPPPKSRWPSKVWRSSPTTASRF